MRAGYLWLGAGVFWLFIATLLGMQILLLAPPGQAAEVQRVFTWQVLFYLAWIPFTVAIWYGVARWPVLQVRGPRMVAVHLAAAAVVAVLHASVVVPLAHAFAPAVGESIGQMIVGQVRGRIYTQIVIYTGVVAAAMAFVMYGRWQEQSARAAALEGQLAAATLSALRAQLHPHLLFNSLHAVASLVRESRNPEAVRLIADLGQLLRKVLDTNHVWHSVIDELALVRTFFDIQRVRFENRLVTTIDLAPDAEDGVVPVLVVQPLVENALRHGLANKVGIGHVTVTVRRDGDWLMLEVADDGVGAGAPGNRSPGGTGLPNLRARLETLYEGRATMSTGARQDGGFVVTIHVPYRPS